MWVNEPLITLELVWLFQGPEGSHLALYGWVGGRRVMQETKQVNENNALDLWTPETRQTVGGQNPIKLCGCQQSSLDELIYYHSWEGCFGNVIGYRLPVILFKM